MIDSQSFKMALRKTSKGFGRLLPIIFGVLLLVSLLNAPLFKNFVTRIFSGNSVADPLIGAFLGSVLTGNPITSYIIGGELLRQGVSYLAVVAFILTWVTVGVVQLPAEAAALGGRFALLRNVVSFVSALIIAALVVLTLSII